MNHLLSKAERDQRSEQLNPVSSEYYRVQGYSTDKAARLASIEQERLQIKAAHQNQIKQHKKD